MVWIGHESRLAFRLRFFDQFNLAVTDINQGLQDINDIFAIQRANALRGISPKAARFFVDRARRHRLDRLVERHHYFVEADKDLKRGGSSAQQVLERLLVALFS